MDIELFGQFGQRLLALDSGQSHLRLEGRAVVPAWSFRHALSCSRQPTPRSGRLHLSRLFRFPEPALTLPSCLASSSKPSLPLIIFWSLVIVGVLVKRRGRALRNPDHSAPGLGSRFGLMTPNVRSNIN